MPTVRSPFLPRLPMDLPPEVASVGPLQRAHGRAAWATLVTVALGCALAQIPLLLLLDIVPFGATAYWWKQYLRVRSVYVEDVRWFQGASLEE